MATVVHTLDFGQCDGWPMILELGPLGRAMTDDEFFEFCQLNRKLRIERSSTGEILVMPPAGADSSRRNCEVVRQLSNWAKVDATGIAFDSSAGFTLANGAERSPDAAWVRRDRWEALTPFERTRFAPLCPEFVLEIRSPSDRLVRLNEKLLEFVSHGAQLGWLIDPIERKVLVYRPGEEAVVLDNPPSVSADPVLPGFTLELGEILA
jgi:Uma2 family endonuclease